MWTPGCQRLHHVQGYRCHVAVNDVSNDFKGHRLHELARWCAGTKNVQQDPMLRRRIPPLPDLIGAEEWQQGGLLAVCWQLCDVCCQAIVLICSEAICAATRSAAECEQKDAVLLGTHKDPVPE